MMKKFLCLMLCLALALPSVCAMAADDYTLAEKLQRQIEAENGVKGAVVLNVSGEGDVAKLLAPLSGTEIQIRFIQNNGQFQTSLYTLEGETQVGLTQLYGNDQDVYLRTALLPELILTYHTGGDIMSRLAGLTEEENPAWYTAAMNLLTVPETVWNEDWAPLLEGYYTNLELWLNDYAAAPQVNQADGETVMTARYTIPAEAVKAQTKALLAKVLTDEALLSQLKAQLSDSQLAAYLTPGFLYHYEAAIDALPLEGEIVLERDVSTMGESVSTSVTLPLPGTSGWESLMLEQIGEDTSMSLMGSSMTVSLEMTTANASATSAEYSGVIRVVPVADDAQAMAVAFQLKKVFNHSVDADTRSHDVTTWTLNLSADESTAADEGFLNFEPVTASLMTHLHSKNAKSNATTLEISASVSQGTETLSLAGSIKTSSPWVLDQLPTDGAEDVSAMAENFREEIFAQLWANVTAQLSALNPEELPVPETAQTATPTDVTTDVPAAAENTAQ